MTDTDTRKDSALQGSVGWIGIVFFVVAAAAPLTVVFGSLPRPSASAASVHPVRCSWPGWC